MRQLGKIMGILHPTIWMTSMSNCQTGPKSGAKKMLLIAYIDINFNGLLRFVDRSSPTNKQPPCPMAWAVF